MYREINDLLRYDSSILFDCLGVSSKARLPIKQMKGRRQSNKAAIPLVTRSASCKLLRVLPPRPYALQQCMNTITSTHVRSASKKYLYPDFKTNKGKLMAKLQLFKSYPEGSTPLHVESRQRDPMIRTQRRSSLNTSKIGFSDLVTFYMQTKASSTHRMLAEPPFISNRHNEEVFEHIYLSGKSSLKRRACRSRMSLPDL